MAQARQGEVKARRNRARAWAIGASLVTHAIALVLLAWTTPILRLPVADWRPDVVVELNRPTPLPQPPRPREATASPRPSATPPARSPVVSQRRPQPIPIPPRPVAAPVPARPLPPVARPAPPFPAPAAPAPGQSARPGPPAPSPHAGEANTSGGDVRGAVRAAIGCSHETFLQLSPAEREACERKMAEAPPHSGAYVDPIPPLKRGAFDRQAAADARRRDHEGPMENPITPCAPGTPGSNYGVGCLPPSAMHHVPFGATPRPPAPDPEP